MKKKKRFSKNEFRFNKKTKHINYVFEESYNKFNSVGLTTKAYTFGIKNMPLKFNPKNKSSVVKSYVRNGIISDSKRNFTEKPYKTWSFEKSDFANVKSKIRAYKKRRK